MKQDHGYLKKFVVCALACCITSLVHAQARKHSNAPTAAAKTISISKAALADKYAAAGPGRPLALRLAGPTSFASRVRSLAITSPCCGTTGT